MKKYTILNRKGFTLIEMLLVIAIIAVLAAIVIVAINPARQLAQAQNTQRQSDLRAINDGVKQYYIDNESWPPNDVITTNLVEVCDENGLNSEGVSVDSDPDACVDLRVLIPDYLAQIPSDPNHTPPGTNYFIALNKGQLQLTAPSSTDQGLDLVAIGTTTDSVDGGGGGGAVPDPDPVDGVCGTATQTTHTSAPTTNLCEDGATPTVSGDGPWTWTCPGSNGGNPSDLCTAEKAGPSIVKIASINDIGTYSDVWADDNYVYTTNYSSGLHAYTFDGVNFTHIAGVYDGGQARSVWGDGNYIYIANWADGIRAYTFNGSSFTPAGNVDWGCCSSDVWGDGSYIYSSSASGGLYTYTFNGLSFSLVKQTNIGAYSGAYSELLRSVLSDGNYVYSADEKYGLHAYSLPTSVSYINSIDDFIGFAGYSYVMDLAIDNNYIYTATSYDGLRSYTFNGSSFQNVGSEPTPSRFYNVKFYDNYIYTTNSSYDLSVYTFDGVNFTNILNSTELDTNEDGLFVDNSYIYAVDYDGGLKAYTFNP